MREEGSVEKRKQRAESRVFTLATRSNFALDR
jgi:hypothetical protein